MVCLAKLGWMKFLRLSMNSGYYSVKIGFNLKPTESLDI